jgi:hypothetical protein
MLVLFDNGTPRDLARYLIDHHTITEARARGWGELENGELLTAAETLIKPHIAKIVAAVNAATPGSYAEVEIPENQ